MSVATAFLAMPYLLMTLCLAGGRRLSAFPGKDDLWKLPKPSSLR